MRFAYAQFKQCAESITKIVAFANQIALSFVNKGILSDESGQMAHDPIGCTSLKQADQFPELTEGQKTCLRLVDKHHTSKEIGRILSIMYQLQEAFAAR